MLKKLILENWKSFRHAVLDIAPLTVLIGTNASGKSNALEALEFLKRTVEGREFQSALVGDLIVPSIRGGVEWAALKPETKFTLKVLIQGEDDSTYYLYSITVETKPQVQLMAESLILIKQTVKSEKETEKEILFQTEPPTPYGAIEAKIYDTNNQGKQAFLREKSILSQLIFQSFPGLLPKDSVVGKLAKGIFIIWETISNIFTLDPIPSKMRSYSPLSPQLLSDASNIAGVLAALPDEQKKQVESTILTYVKHLPEKDIQKIWAEPVGRLNSDAMLYCEEQWIPAQPPMLIDARGMSDGTLRFLGIIAALMTRPEGSQLIVEDVDNGLHPSRSELLVKMLRGIGKKRKIDILVTTHNPSLLDALGREIVPFVVVAHRDTETGKSKLTLVEDIQNFSQMFASACLGKLKENSAIERSVVSSS
ncbi:AAA family ATPase [Microseira wollei]|uniref:ATPase-like protein n=1 Tax=Microseira wollei NIES-4236 TaxID=2530354 RepID=A0AAV3X8S8_9CYAN|nr:ATP-binding protein [Microseira wollei]GET38240.1 ATPase-like protein [Microseira wollei NIES-4236]